MTLAIFVSLLCFLTGATGAAAVVAVANHFEGVFAEQYSHPARIDRESSSETPKLGDATYQDARLDWRQQLSARAFEASRDARQF